MSYTLRIRPAADANVDEIAMHILRESAEQASRFYEAVDVTYRQILMRPQAWPRLMVVTHPALGELRHRSVVGFPNHLVVYRVEETTVLVLRIVHAARDLPAVLFRELSPEPE
jgi:toxin ParE1/3/4